MSLPFDPSAYVRKPVINVASGFALGCALVAACPKAAPADVKRAVRKLRSAVVNLQQEWLKRDKTKPKTDRRGADRRLDNAWGALFGRLESYARLPADEYPDAARAAELLTAMFSDGLGFVKLPYEQEWAESDKRLRLVETNKLAGDIDRVAGPMFLAEVRRAHELYGKALGVTEAVATYEEASLAGPLRAVQDAVVGYALRLIATAEEDDPSSVAMVRAALAPLDAHRAAQGRRAVEADNPVDPHAPVPDVPGGPTDPVTPGTA